MTFERKESKQATAKQAESSLVQKIAAHPENVMDSYGQRSMGVAIAKLSDRYFKGKTDKEIENVCNDTVNELKTLADSKIDANLKAGIEHILTKIQDKPELYDTVAIYLPVKGTEPLQYNYVNSYFALKQVLTLSWLAVHDDKQFAHHPVNPKLTAEEARKERRERMLQSFHVLKTENPCHVGHRHQLVFPLNKSAIDVDVIADGNTPILHFLKENIYPLFWKKWKDDTTTDTIKKELLAAYFTWMKDNNITTLITLVDPTQTILSGLKELFIQHGSDADKTEESYQLALQFANFEPNANFAASRSLHALLTAEDIRHHAAYNNVINIIKSWIETQFDLTNQQHQEWIRQIHILQEAYDLLHRYNLLLILAGKRDSFKQLENFLNTFFRHFQIETLNSVPEDMLTAAIELRAAVAYSKKHTLKDQIENFFTKWFSAQRIFNASARNRELSLHYATLLNHDFQTKVRLTDETIQRLVEKAATESKDEKLDIEPYQVSRFFLHAIMTNPTSQDWSDLFTYHLKIVLAFVKNYFNEENVSHAAALKRDSYPDRLIFQIEYLISVREGQPLRRPVSIIVLPQSMETTNEWLEIVQWVDQPTREALYKNVGSVVRRFAREATPIIFTHIACSIPVEALVDFLKATGVSKLPAFPVSATADFTSQLTKIPKQQIDTLVNIFIDEHCSTNMLSVSWLSHFFRIFSDDIQENTIERYLKVSMAENNLFENLKIFPPEKRKALLKNMKKDDIIKMLESGSAQNLLNGLACFPVEECFAILSKLPDDRLCDWNKESRDFFKKIIDILPNDSREPLIAKYCSLGIHVNCWQLAAMIGSLPCDKINGFLTTLGVERIHEIFSSSIPIGHRHLLSAIPIDNWQHLFNLLGKEYLNEKLFSVNHHVMELFRDLHNQRHKLERLIAYIGNERLRRIVKDETSLENLLKELPDERVGSFLRVNIGCDTLKEISFSDYAYYFENSNPHLLLAHQIAEHPECQNELAHAKAIVAEICTLLKETIKTKITRVGSFFSPKPYREPMNTPTQDSRQSLTIMGHLEDQIRKAIKNEYDDLDQLLNLYAAEDAVEHSVVRYKTLEFKGH